MDSEDSYNLFWSSSIRSGGTTSVRKHLKEELVGKVCYDHEPVFERIQASRIDDGLVEKCLAQYQSDIRVKKALEQLQMLEDRASGLTGEPARKNEREMYPHLSLLMHFIQQFYCASTGRRESREFVITSGQLGEPHTPGFPDALPDFRLTGLGCDANSNWWSNQDAFLEVKPTKGQSPKPENARESTIQPTTAQVADYARLHLSARPFLLFSVGLLLCGSELYVGIFDRDGITFSPARDIRSDTEEFIRVICAMTCEASAPDLGADPSVKRLDKQLGTGIEDQKYKSYIINPVGEDTRKWCTIGAPLWSSVSLLGRGTMVWKVQEYDETRGAPTGLIHVLKTAWRSGHRDSETKIYRSVEDPPAGLAVFTTGGDVTNPLVPNDHTAVISVQALRTGYADVPDSTPVLHRIVVATVGRPIWTYTSDKEFVEGILAAVQAHRDLCGKNLLHRDISAGNVLLAENPSTAPSTGFLMDLEFAKVMQSEMNYNRPIVRVFTHPAPHKHIVYSSQPQRGAAMTGTLQFMALEILEAIKKQTPIEHTIDHDIESFAWVIGYAVSRRLMEIAQNIKAKDQYEALKEGFLDGFGKLTVHEIISARKTAAPFSFLTTLEMEQHRVFRDQSMSLPLQDMCVRLMRVLLARGSNVTFERDAVNQLRNPDGAPQLVQLKRNFTHDDFIAFLQDTIEEMGRKM